ncbi:MAG: hypothetical protein IE933_10390 [Sphingomonadales bacterium]|nr:hypothetical protein [Sphingomonadales bacterium]MBD3773224.1 hypothetical protein [Paracoccaceae bacterium]
MIRAILSVGAALAAVAAPAAFAQGSAPQIRTVAAPPAQPIDPHYTAYCAKDRLSVPYDGGPVNRLTFFSDEGKPALIALCSDRYRSAAILQVEDLRSALAFMAYKPFAPFWPAAEQRWGADLGKLRADVKADAEETDGSTYSYGHMVTSKTARIIDQAHRLTDIGYFGEALALLDTREADLIRKAGDEPHYGDYGFDLAMLAITHASTLTAQHGPGAAADYLASFSETHDVGPDYAINLAINRAAYLAEAERADEALAVLLPAWQLFRGDTTAPENYQISGSDREFSWILGCAYWQQGKRDKAERYIASVDSAVEQPADPFLAKTKRSTLIRLRMHACMDDADGYFASWDQAQEPILSAAWIEFQRGATTGVVSNRKPWIENDPRAAKIGAKYRQLPESYQPALHRWAAGE